MTFSFHCSFGVPLDLRLKRILGVRVELYGLEFIGSVPTQWRLRDGNTDLTPWLPGIPEFRTIPLHNLSNTSMSGTRGLPLENTILETCGDGEATVLTYLQIVE